MEILIAILDVARWIVILHVILSWLVNFDVLNSRNTFVATIYYQLERLLEPIYRPIRRILPTPGGLDFSPIVLLIGLQLLRGLLLNAIY